MPAMGQLPKAVLPVGTAARVLTHLSGLTNDIHPVFAEDRWLEYEESKYGRLDGGKALYPLLVPVLRLASALLTHREALPFWHTLLVMRKWNKE